MSLFRSLGARLAVTHVVAALVGVAAGALYETKLDPTTRDAVHEWERRPLLDAATIAFRFGSPAQARVTNESVLRMPRTNARDFTSVMLAELRLAAIHREMTPHARATPHLDAARAACRRLGRPDCSADQLRASAMKLSHGGSALR